MAIKYESISSTSFLRASPRRPSDSLKISILLTKLSVWTIQRGTHILSLKFRVLKSYKLR